MAIVVNKAESKTRTQRRKSDKINPGTIFFDKNGNVSLESNTALAKIEPRAKGDAFYLKVSTQARDSGHPANPRGLYFNAEDLTRMSNTNGKPLYDYKMVSKTTFDDYIKFLVTKNIDFLRLTERAVLDG